MGKLRKRKRPVPAAKESAANLPEVPPQVVNITDPIRLRLEVMLKLAESNRLLAETINSGILHVSISNCTVTGFYRNGISVDVKPE